MLQDDFAEGVLAPAAAGPPALAQESDWQHEVRAAARGPCAALALLRPRRLKAPDTQELPAPAWVGGSGQAVRWPSKLSACPAG